MRVLWLEDFGGALRCDCDSSGWGKGEAERDVVDGEEAAAVG